MNHLQAVLNARAGDFLPVASAIAHYEAEFDEAQVEVRPTGRLWDTAKRLPGHMVHRYTQLQELEAILTHIEMLEERKSAEAKQRFMETSMRALSDRQVNELLITDNDVWVLRQLQNEVSMVRNKFLGLTKGLEQMHFQMSNLVKLREAGIEDAAF